MAPGSLRISGAPSRAWKDPATLEASALACGLQFAQSFQELVRFSPSGDARAAYVDLLKQGAAGRAEVLTALASVHDPGAAASLKALPPEQWAAFKVTSFSDLGEKALILAHHSETPDLFLGIVLLRQRRGVCAPAARSHELQRLLRRHPVRTP